jgi:hypothetical protein
MSVVTGLCGLLGKKVVRLIASTPHPAMKG